MSASAPALLALGFLLGMRHATDADHVVAVTTVVSRQRGLRGALAIGALWGLGHTVTILIVGSAIILFGVVIPPRLVVALEMAVGAMLILLGVVNLRGQTGAANADHPHPHPTPVRWAWRPLAIGVVHGLAGSAAVALLVLTTIREPGWAVVYLAIFGAGTVLGMMLLTTAMTVPLTAASRRFGTIDRVMGKVTGAFSLAFGLAMLIGPGCSRTADPGGAPSAVTTSDDTALGAVAAVHGGTGPWVVAGYRMGQFALARLGLPRGSFDLEVGHFAPHEVQYSCIVDGAAAATGASLGKLNLALGDAPAGQTRTTYRRRSTGQAVTLRVTPAFEARFLNVPRDGLPAAGREVLRLRDDEIFAVAQ